MLRASSQPAARATDRLIDARKCSCDQSLELQRRISAAQPFLVSAIERLAEIASSPLSAAAEALTECRKALSALENEDG